MNENLDLTKILKDCPKGTKLYSTIHGEVSLIRSDGGPNYPIVVELSDKIEESFTAKGKISVYYDGECILFPSSEQRDWSKFIVPWYKKERFDPKTLKEFDKVLVKEDGDCIWRVDIISVPANYNDNIPYLIGDNDFDWIIPYNEDTKHLIGTKDEAPEYYRYWED